MPIPIYTIQDLFITKGTDVKLSIKQFDIHRGACYAFEGRMGSGKTTFLETLYLRKKISKSKIIFEEKDIYKYSFNDYKKQIAVVPQNFRVPWGRVRNYMLKTLKSYGHINNPERRLNDISKKMKLSPYLDRKIRHLTPGELRWVVLATMISADTKILFIDEFELHLSKRELSTLLSILHKKINYDGITLITSTLNKDLLSRIASVTVTLEKGKITSVRSSGKRKKYNKK